MPKKILLSASTCKTVSTRSAVLALAIALAACASQPLPQRTPPAVEAAQKPLPEMPKAPAVAETVPAQTPSPAPVATTQTPSQPTVIEKAFPTFDKAAALRSWAEQQGRLYRVAAPLLMNNTELCPDHVRNLLGFTARNKYSYTSTFSDVAESALGLDDRLSIMNVLPGSGAEQAGLREGDGLIAVEIEPMPMGPNAEREGAMLVASEIEGRSILRLSLLRNEVRFPADVPLTLACAMVINLGNSDDVNSYADGTRALLTRGMLNFTQSDEELAYVLAKEIAHNILTKSPRADMAAIIDRMQVLTPETVSAAIGENLQPYSPVLDATADKLSLYLLKRAGYDISRALSFWKKLANQFPATVPHSYTALHPSSSYRFSVMAEIEKVIQSKQAHNIPLIP